MLTLNPSFHTTGSFKKWLLVFTTNFICCSLCYYYCALMIYTVDEILKITCKMAENQSFAIKIKFFVQKINLSNILTCQEQRRKPYMSVCAHLHTRFHVTKCRNNDSNSNLWEKKYCQETHLAQQKVTKYRQLFKSLLPQTPTSMHQDARFHYQSSQQLTK